MTKITLINNETFTYPDTEWMMYTRHNMDKFLFCCVCNLPENVLCTVPEKGYNLWTVIKVIK